MASRMQGFVKGRNPGDAADHSAAPHHSRPPTAQKTRNTQRHDGQDNVYETDTEGFDDTRSAFSEYGDEEYDQDEQRNLDNILDLSAEQLGQAMMQMRHHQSTGHQINSDPESYPPTTSGEPESIEDYEAQNEGDFEPRPAQAYVEQPYNVHMTNVPLERHPPALAMPIQQRRVGPSKDDFKAQVKPMLTQKDISLQKQLQSKTQAASQNTAKQVIEQFHPTGQHMTGHKQSSRSPDHALPAPVERFDQSRRQANHRHQQVNGAIHPQQRANRAEPYDQRVKRDDHPQQRFDRADRHEQRFYGAEQHVDSDDRHDQQELDRSPEESHEYDLQPEELDYDLDVLFTKGLEELQGDPFEGPLREEPDVPPTDFSSKALEERLTLAAEFEPSQQKNFLASLTIDEWDRAGDWFHDRFSAVFGKLKNARRERRKLAMEFEEKITERQQEVSNKRKITDEALSEMKVTGAQVLDGTPKKKQKSRE